MDSRLTVPSPPRLASCRPSFVNTTELVTVPFSCAPSTVCGIWVSDGAQRERVRWTHGIRTSKVARRRPEVNRSILARCRNGLPIRTPRTRGYFRASSTLLGLDDNDGLGLALVREFPYSKCAVGGGGEELGGLLRVPGDGCESGDVSTGEKERRQILCSLKNCDGCSLGVTEVSDVHISLDELSPG